MNEKDTKQQDEPVDMPERIYIPHGPAMLMAVSLELQNNEGGWYNLETEDDDDLRSRILSLKTECQGELPSMYNKAIDDALKVIQTTRRAIAQPQEDAAVTAQNRDEAQQVVLDTETALEEKFDGIARHELVSRITAEINDTATRMRDRCVERVREKALKWQRASNGYNDNDGFKHHLIAKTAAANELAEIIKACEL